MRRANLHGPDRQLQYDPHAAAALDSVTVSRQYLDELKKALREYNALRGALIRGGVTVEALDLLVQETSVDGDATPTGQLETSDAAGVHDSTQQQQPYPPDGQQYGGGGGGKGGYGNLNSPTWNFNNPLPFPGSPSHEHGPQGRYPDRQSGFGGDQQNPDQHNNNHNNNQRNGHGKRTIYLTKLPERVTYAKIFDVIRGGAVVDVWVKASDHAASVSFIECDAAENFYQYARKNDIYIDGRRINVDWREPTRQFVILNNIMSAISRGGTRNLLLSKIPPNLTPARIREDLDHIHNLHIEKIEARPGAIVVNLNSVCVALFARTCLMSRGAYKGVKIEFAQDECAGRLPPPGQGRRGQHGGYDNSGRGGAVSAKGGNQNQKAGNNKPVKPKNIFDVLAMEDEDEDDDDGDDDGNEEGEDGEGEGEEANTETEDGEIDDLTSTERTDDDDDDATEKEEEAPLPPPPPLNAGSRGVNGSHVQGQGQGHYGNGKANGYGRGKANMHRQLWSETAGRTTNGNGYRH
ncbi:hypothetical protein DFH27DRAFT_565871 [Peziza echinospora]|nr:hypothetical protein DFH27DRAFT_565871 [Peziza echinospora]